MVSGLPSTVADHAENDVIPERYSQNKSCIKNLKHDKVIGWAGASRVVVQALNPEP